MPQLKSLTALPDALYPLGIDWTLHQFDMIKNKAGAKKDVMLNVFFCYTRIQVETFNTPSEPVFRIAIELVINSNHPCRVSNVWQGSAYSQPPWP